MGCCIHYDLRDGMLRAVVSGRASSHRAGDVAAWIARDITEQAGRETVQRLLIDLRGLADRVGSLGELSMAAGAAGKVGGYRVAVVDAVENDGYYAPHELAARARGHVLRCFTSAAEAAHWLRAVPDFD